MPDYRHGAHTVLEIHLHLDWITKYRRPALTGEVATRVRDLIRDICAQHEVTFRLISAYALLRAERYAEASTQPSRILDLDERFWQTYLILTLVYAWQGKFMEALPIAEKGYALAPWSGPVPVPVRTHQPAIPQSTPKAPS